MKPKPVVTGTDEQGMFTVSKYFLLMLMLCFVVFAPAQTTTKREGNVYTEITRTPTVAGLTKNAVKDGTTFKTKAGETYDVWRSAGGKLFVVRISKKTGNPYKQYLN